MQERPLAEPFIVLKQVIIRVASPIQNRKYDYKSLAYYKKWLPHPSNPEYAAIRIRNLTGRSRILSAQRFEPA
jgi:hypothetical protein